MPFALLLALVAVAGATTLTYLYDRDAPIWSRLCAGVCLGFASLGLAGFVLASLMGMTPLALTLAGAVCGSPLLLLLWRGEWRELVSADIGEGARVLSRALMLKGRGETGTLVFYLVAAVLFWFVFAHAMYQTPQGIFTGVDTNIGDLPFHIAVVNGFAYGENFPPQHPEFAGVRLTYPFVVDFVTAMFVRAGAGLEGAMFWQNFAMMMSLVGLMHRWALKLTRSRMAALLVPLLVLLSGGFGWRVFLSEAWSGGGRGVFDLLGSLPHDYTIMGDLGYRWGNAVTALFVTQRSILLGVALALIIWTLWWEASEKAKGKRQKAKEESEERARVASKLESRGAGKETARSKGKGKSKSKQARGRAAREAGVLAESDAVTQGDSAFAFCLLPFAFREMIAAGIIAGLLPLVHAHSFVVMMSMGACMALLQGVASLVSKREADGVKAQTVADSNAQTVNGIDERTDARVWKKVWTVWRPWVVFAAAASVLALPQMFWATRESAVRAGQFFGWEFGWDHGTENVVWFWLKNTGVFIPLLVAALVWRGRDSVGRERASVRGERASEGASVGRGHESVVSGKLLFFYLPFVFCFIVPNVYKLSPWVWDNIKVLLYWWIASAPLVALVLARLWRRGSVAWRVVVAALLLMQVAAGGLDVWRAASGAVERRSFDPAGVAFAEVIRRETPPRALILHAPTYNDPVYLTGRRTFLGFTGHIWSHGIDYSEREADLKRIYAGTAEAPALIDKAGIDYVVVGPLEREELKKYGVTINETFFAQLRKVGEAGGYRLYKTRP
ncbi:MAG: hypothetical protein QOC99_3639 [Acidobacteriota bacterium]|nr:hypothetical protein [Acidobacteriota bacterium]